MENHLRVSLHPCTYVYIRVNSYMYIQKNIFSVRWQKNGNDYKYMNFGRERFALKCPLYSHSSYLAKIIKKKKMGDYMDRVEALAYNRTSKSINRLYRWQWYWWQGDFGDINNMSLTFFVTKISHRHRWIQNLSLGILNILGEIGKVPYNVYNMEVMTFSAETFMEFILNFRPFTIFEMILLKLIIFSIQIILNKCILMRLKRSRNGQRINWNAGIVPQAGFHVDSRRLSESEVLIRQNGRYQNQLETSTQKMAHSMRVPKHHYPKLVSALVTTKNSLATSITMMVGWVLTNKRMVSQ